jgi:hypothetical protein
MGCLDSIFFARVLDRFWQNIRRAAGFNVQYGGGVELQRRLAPHAHFAVRGTMPRKLVRQVAAATYHQVWWPQFHTALFTVDKAPEWNEQQQSYVDPKTGDPLPTWQAALDALDDPDATPAHVARLGTIDARGIDAGSKDADRAIKYVTSTSPKTSSTTPGPAPTRNKPTSTGSTPNWPPCHARPPARTGSSTASSRTRPNPA